MEHDFEPDVYRKGFFAKLGWKKTALIVGASALGLLGLYYLLKKKDVSADDLLEQEPEEQKSADYEHVGEKDLTLKRSTLRRKLIDGNVHYKVSLALLKGKKYYGYAEISFKRSSLPGDLSIDFLGKILDG